MSFYYQDLDLYYIASGFVDSVLEILKKYGPVLSNQLTRLETMAMDIPLSIARTTGKFDRRLPSSAIYEMRSYVFECQAMVELLWRSKQIRESDADELSDTLITLANMLDNLAAQASETSRKLPRYRPKPPEDGFDYP